MIRASDLIRVFQRMYTEHWDYELGKAEQGTVDCSGAFVYAYKLLGGGSIPHGSNSIYRQSVGWVSPIPVPGYAAFKIRKDGGEPERYQDDGIGNVYHIGLVDSDGKHILNAKGSRYGFCRDEVKGWTCYAPLKKVDYEERTEEDMPETMYKVVVATTSGSLNLRARPARDAQCITSVPKGETLEVVGEEGEWLRVRYGDIIGYVSRKYTHEIEGSAEAIGAGKTEDNVGTSKLETTTIINEKGQALTLVGVWWVAID